LSPPTELAANRYVYTQKTIIQILEGAMLQKRALQYLDSGIGSKI
jgi:hypothetical protein